MTTRRRGLWPDRKGKLDPDRRGVHGRQKEAVGPLTPPDLIPPARPEAAEVRQSPPNNPYATTHYGVAGDSISPAFEL